MLPYPEKIPTSLEVEAADLIGLDIPASKMDIIEVEVPICRCWKPSNLDLLPEEPSKIQLPNLPFGFPDACEEKMLETPELMPTIETMSFTELNEELNIQRKLLWSE